MHETWQQMQLFCAKHLFFPASYKFSPLPVKFKFVYILPSKNESGKIQAGFTALIRWINIDLPEE